MLYQYPYILDYRPKQWDLLTSILRERELTKEYLEEKLAEIEEITNKIFKGGEK